MLGANVRPAGANNTAGANPDNPELTSEELDAARTREITAKAVSGIMLLLLKWLKLSRESIVIPQSHNYANKVFLLPRYSQIRILDTTSFGLQLHAFGAQALPPSRRPTSC